MANQIKCSSCGQLFHEWELEKINPGRRVQYVCKECYKNGDIDARIREVMRGQRKRKENER